MGGVAKLLSSTFLSAFRGGAGRTLGTAAQRGEAALFNEAWEAATRSGGEKVVAGVAEKSGSLLGRSWSWIRGNPKTTAAVVGGAAGVHVANNAWQAFKESLLGKIIYGSDGRSNLPWLLGAAAVGGLFLAFKDRIFGSDEPREAELPAAALPPLAATSQEQLLQPQMSLPPSLIASTVTASYPAAVGSVSPQRTQAAPPPATNWQERVGRPQAPTVAMKPQTSYLAAEQVRDQAAATAQNGVA